MKIDIMTKNKDKKTIVPPLRFPEFSENEEWTIVPLKKHAKQITEKAKNGNYMPLSVTSGVGLVSQMEKFGREIAGEQYKNYYVINKFDFAYNKSATTLYPEGYISMLKNFERGAVPNSIFSCFSVDKNEINPQYLDQLFQDNFHGKWLRNYIEVGSRANGALSIDSKILLNLLIPLPKLKEQLKIKDCLSCLDDLISAVANKIETLKEYKKGLMQQLFPAEGKTIPAIRFPEFQNAEEWQTVSLGDVATFINGRAFKQDELLESGKYRVLRVGNFFSNANWYHSDLELDENKYCDKGDLLYAWSASFGPRIWNEDKVIFHYHIWKVVEKEGISKDFLLILLDYETERIKNQQANGLGLLHITKGAIESWKTRVPMNILEQQKIAKNLSSVDELIITEIAKLDQLKAHKKGLMQQLFPKL